jgi:hypothetical protein
LAKDSSGGLVVVDLWKRGGDRNNSNIVVMGVAGVGKSTAVKHIALSEYMKGTKIIFIDPESEYKELCKLLNGDWINAGGGSNGKINPLQIRPAPRDDENEEFPLYKDEGNDMSDMALHLKNLEIFFNLYIPDLTMMQKAVLKQCLIELYNQFHITWTINLLSWCWEQMSKDRTERVLLISDECYLMIDPNVPLNLVFLRNVEKRVGSTRLL